MDVAPQRRRVHVAPVARSGGSARSGAARRPRLAPVSRLGQQARAERVPPPRGEPSLEFDAAQERRGERRDAEVGEDDDGEGCGDDCLCVRRRHHLPLWPRVVERHGERKRDGASQPRPPHHQLHAARDLVGAAAAAVGELCEREDVERAREQQHDDGGEDEGEVPHLVALHSVDAHVGPAVDEVVDDGDAEDDGEGDVAEGGEGGEEGARGCLGGGREVVVGVVPHRDAGEEEGQDAREGDLVGERVGEQRGDQQQRQLRVRARLVLHPEPLGRQGGEEARADSDQQGERQDLDELL
mmetsp:Transcript_35585/g.113861  ORF Transcript_35585/g.113861 Transcript_35585/m.113861 type:complete len:298 (-) Transcript_35585:53-946(-)